MTYPAFRHATLDDFKALHQHVDTRFTDLRDADEVYFLGDHTTTFALRAAAIAHGLPNFAGVAVFSVSPEKRIRLAQQLPVRADWRFIGIPDLIARAATKRIVLVDFNDALSGKQIADSLARQGVPVCDCLLAMDQLGQIHTYQTVRAEREHLAANLGSFIALAERFDDDWSRTTLHARLHALLTLDRRALIEASFPLQDFINNHSTQAGIVVGADDVFVDAGAAHGDTVAHFHQVARGSYRAIHAFEPDSQNYAALENLCGYLPNVRSYRAGLGSQEEEVDFFEMTGNRLGSNFAGIGEKTRMAIRTIDATVEDATLVKVDVEGWEAQVLQGGARTIASRKPNMTVSAYHYAKDIPELVATVDALARYRYVGLRHYTPGLYDTQLMFSDTQDFR